MEALSHLFKDCTENGAFHIALTLLAVTGKRFGDGGLHNLFVESGIVGPKAVSGVLLGKHYNRALCCHKTILEALLRKKWSAFNSWLCQDTSLSRHCQISMPYCISYVTVASLTKSILLLSICPTSD